MLVFCFGNNAQATLFNNSVQLDPHAILSFEVLYNIAASLLNSSNACSSSISLKFTPPFNNKFVCQSIIALVDLLYVGATFAADN